MLVIRLRRIGRTHDPHYRIVVAEHTAPVQGKFLSEIGHYHPKSKELVINKESFMDWLSKGAKPSNTVAKLAQRQKLEHKQIVVKQYEGKPKKKAQEATAAKTEVKEKPAEPETSTEVTEVPSEESTETPAEEPTEAATEENTEAAEEANE